MDDSHKSHKIRCPECSNYVNIHKKENGAYMGQCPICNVVISTKQLSKEEKVIKIRKKLKKI